MAAMLAIVALGALWSIVTPLGEGPDEPAHLGLVLHLADGNGYPDVDELRNPAATLRLCRVFAAAIRACPNPGEPVTPTSMRRHPRSAAPARSGRPAWDDMGGDAPVGRVSQMPQHPPLYYQAMATVLRLERALPGSTWSLDRELALLRLANVLLLAPLPALAWSAVRRLGLGDPPAVVAASAVLCVPMVTHIGAVLNNDNLLTLLAAVLIAQLAGVTRGDRSPATALGIGISVGLAMLTKAFAVVFVPTVALAYLVGAAAGIRGAWREALGRWWRPVALAAGGAVVVGGWWYVAQRIRTGTFTPSTVEERINADLRTPGFEADVRAFSGEFVRRLQERFWGSFGWYTVRFPRWVTVPATLAAAACTIAGLVRGVPVDRGRVRAPLAVLLTPLFLLAAMVWKRAWNLHALSSAYPFIQGRYLFAGVVGTVAVAAIGVTVRDARVALPAVALVAVLMQVLALRHSVAGWWGGPGLGPADQVAALAAWSAWPPAVVTGAFVAAVASAGWLAVEVALWARARAEGAHVVEPVD